MLKLWFYPDLRQRQQVFTHAAGLLSLFGLWAWEIPTAPRCLMMLSTSERHTSPFALVIVIRRVTARTLLEILLKTAFAAAESVAELLLAVVNNFVYVVTRRATKNI